MGQLYLTWKIFLPRIVSCQLFPCHDENEILVLLMSHLMYVTFKQITTISIQNVAGYRHCGVPWSCCLRKFERNRQCGYGLRKARSHFQLENEIHTTGCLDRGFEFFKNNMLMIAGLAIAFTLPLIMGILMTHRFVKQIRKQVYSD